MPVAYFRLFAADRASLSRPTYGWRNALTRDERGDVTVLLGLMALVLFMAIGLAVDYGRWSLAREQTISATDAAVLAAGRTLQTNGGDEAAALTVAETFYKNATSGRLAVLDDTISFQVSESGTVVTTVGNAHIQTPFMGIGGVRTLPLLRPARDGITRTTDDYSTAKFGAGKNAGQNVEIAMMLDVSGSMGEGTKLSDMKDAASDLVNIVVWDDQSTYTSRVALVPFSGDVRPPPSVLTSVTGSATALPKTKGNGKSTTTYLPTDCVVERGGTNRYHDVAPAAGSYLLRHYTESGACYIGTANTVVPLTSEKTSLTSAIGGLTSGGSTAGHIGTAWSYYSLSPKWSSTFNLSQSAANWNAKDTKKIAVLMTDGMYNSTHDSDGVDATASSSINSTDSSTQAKNLCEAMKADNVEIYTVGFQLDDSTAIATLQACATDASHFYQASTGDELKNAFRDIALKTIDLYISN